MTLGSFCLTHGVGGILPCLAAALILILRFLPDGLASLPARLRRAAGRN